ncbi:hypothetical protein HK105_203282 [Polyrhizophydium stewartii]|uniref:Glutathione S-transferase n=1 Tax=Polyrhizophydium stewartii TaxID=2732419 RepID=A0ABR4NCH0_9FUNG
MTAHPSLKLTYFDLRARAEATRLALTIGGIPFEDHRVARSEWPELKKKTPFGQLPVLTVDGKTQIAQSHGVLRYAGALAGLYPTADALKAALVDQIVLQLEDMNGVIFSRSFANDEEKMAARRAIAEKTFPDMFAAMDAVIAKHTGGKWCVGDSMTVADISLYVFVTIMKTGVWDGIPATLADSYAHVMRVFNGVASHPKVIEWEAAHRK